MNNVTVLLRRMCLTLLVLAASPGYAEDLLGTYKLAVQNDPQLQQAIASHQADLENKPQSLAQLLPDFSVSANTIYNAQDLKYSNPLFNSGARVFNSHGYSATLTQPIFHENLFVQYEESGIRVLQSNAELLSAEQDLIVRVSQAYFNVLQAEDGLRFARAEKNADEKQLEQTKQRFKVGLLAITDVHEAQASYDLAVAKEIQATNQLANTREALRQITGRYLASLAPLGENMPLIIPAPEDIDKWTDIALEKNLDLVAARHATEVALDEVRRQRAGHYPTLDMVMNSSNTVQAGGAFGAFSVNSDSVALQLNVPIFQGGMVASLTRQAQDKFIQAQQAQEQQRRAAVNQTRQAFLGVQSNISLVKAYKQAIVSNSSALEATEAGLEVGTRTTVDVLNARSNLFSARFDYAQSRYNYIISTMQLKQAGGALTDDDVLTVNRWLQ